MEVFRRELDALLRHLGIADQYVVLGQSCGGMLAMERAFEHPAGLKGLVICDSMPSFPLWVEEADKLRSQLPPEVEETLRSHRRARRAGRAGVQSKVCHHHPVRAGESPVRCPCSPRTRP